MKEEMHFHMKANIYEIHTFIIIHWLESTIIIFKGLRRGVPKTKELREGKTGYNSVKNPCSQFHK